ncbi:DMT family transporter [Methanobacterium aggregans]|uniref:DMT family transporter n=1 Tax=Methanobacterium aggregans TaxID=1615586 RepID=UPI00315A3B28|nr:drug/metabolite transporter (DMT)-like permease [Methanobacterium aggregans]
MKGSVPGIPMDDPHEKDCIPSDSKRFMSKKWGYLSVIVATLLFGIWNTFNKILLEDLDPIALSAIVYCIAGAFLFIIRFSPLNNRIMSFLDADCNAETHISRRDYLILLVTAVSGSVIAPIIYLNGLKLITAVTASLLMNVEILFIILIGVFFLRESLKRKDILGFICLVTGTVFLAVNGSPGNFSAGLTGNLGTILVIVAAFFWSIDTSLSKFLSGKRDLLFVSALKCSIGGLILLSLSIVLGSSFSVPLNHVPYLLFIGLVSIGFSFVLVYFAIRQIGSTRTGSLFSLSALFGAIFAFAILNEPFTIFQLVFGLLMLLGVFILYKNGT